MRRIIAVFTLAAMLGALGAAVAWAATGNPDEAGLVPRPRIVPTVAESRAARPAPVDASKLLVSEVWVDDDYTSGTTGWGIDHFATIQEGVDATSAGGTVNVAAGVYLEHDIFVDKHLALLGAGTTTTFIDGSDEVVALPGGTGILLSGATAGAGVTELTGFTLRNPARFATGDGWDESYSVRLTGGQVGATYRLHGLVFQGDDDYDNLADFGFYSHGDAGASLEFDHNTIFDHTSNPLLVEVHRGPTNIHDNTITTVGEAYAVYYMTYSGADVTTLQRIANNNIDVSTPWTYGSASGIGFTNGYFSDYIGRYDQVEISNNTITGLGSGRRGISLYNGALSSPAASEIGRVSCVLTGNSVTGTGGATSYGVRLLGLVSNAALSGSRMHGLAVGLLSTGAVGNYPAGVVAQGGSFAGNDMNVVNDNAASTLNASGSWWGTVSPAGVAASVSAGIDYTPWLNAEGDPSTLWVGASGPQAGTTGRVQEAVNMVAASTVNLLAGTYVEQVEITRSVTLIGEGPTTIIQSPVTLALSYTPPASTINKPIVYVHDTANAVLRGLTVDGAGRGNLNYRFQGVGFWNAGGALIDCAVLNVSDTPFSGAQHGVGIYAYNNTGGPYSLALTNVNISGFQKNATALSGNGLTVALSNVIATGAGPTAITAQNGIQVGSGAGGTINGCAVSGIHYSGALNYTATGLLLYAGSPVVVTDTQLLQNQINAYFIDTSGGFSGTVTGASGTKAYDGIYLYNDGAGKVASDGRRPLPQPYDAFVAAKADKAVNMVVAITNSTITGAAVPDMGGIAAWGSANSIDLTASGNTITNWDYGVFTYEEPTGAVTADCRNNNILNNISYGFYSNTLPAADARNCWWGSITGPQNAALNPGGLGNEVSDNVLFEPWTGQASLAIAPATSGPLTCAGSQLLAFDYTPDPLSPAVKGYSVTVETSAAITFDDGDVLFTTLPSGATFIPQFTEVTAGHKYILDYAVLSPANTGFTGPTTLFTINFHAAGEGTGTVHMSDLAFRDIDNAPVPVGAMGDATVTVDCTAPGAVATVTASPGHRQVKVDWTASASTDLAGYEVWRAMWHRASVVVSAYPEYDDYADDATPTPPAAYGSWNGGEWVLAATVPAGTLTCTDTGDTNRGVYYYEVFAKDLAGNYSLPAVAIDRATNYWLGDVRHQGVGDYDGIVYSIDITALGAYYGTTVPLLEPVAVAAKVDVGPTDDRSRKGIPTTDSKINFEDLMVFAMNFGSSGPPAKALDPTPGGSVALTWARLDDLNWSLRLDGPCAGLRGVNVSATLPQGVTARVEPGALISGQSDPTFVKNIGANGLDAGLAIFGENAAIAGTGELLRVTTTAAIDLSRLTITARGVANEDLGTTVTQPDGTSLPRVFTLAQNVPNPFNPMTKIGFALPADAAVRLRVFGVDGRLVRTLIDGRMAAGSHDVIWDGRSDSGRLVASGTYFCRIEAGEDVQTRKMSLMK